LEPGKVAVHCWPGQPSNPNVYQGIRWLHADNWTTYQRTNFVTPAFPGYISGHSTFSRSAAEALTAITGTPFFPGGLGSYTITNLINELGPSQPVTLQWATYFDAADQVGISRIWGGIHPPVDDFAGRRVGAQCGQGAWALARKYFDGSVARSHAVLALRRTPSGNDEVRYNTLRGFYYKLQSTTNLNQAFADESGNSERILDPGTISTTNTAAPNSKFYRVAVGLTP
jgi:hypothetical protein